jgi:hypothetical protein
MTRINGLTEDEVLYLRASLSRHRKIRHLSPIQAANLLKRALDNGEKKNELEDKVGISIDMINKILRLCSIKDPLIMTSISWGIPERNEISMSAASELGRLDDVKDQKLVYGSILKYGFTKKEVKELVTLYGRSDMDIDSCIDQIKAARPEIIHTKIIIGKITCDSLIDKLSLMPGIERNKLFRDSLFKNIPFLKFKGANLKKSKFIIVGDEQTEAQLSSLGNNIEDVITDFLIKETGEN